VLLVEAMDIHFAILYKVMIETTIQKLFVFDILIIFCCKNSQRSKHSLEIQCNQVEASIQYTH
jgi:hypothetical protein